MTITFTVDASEFSRAMQVVSIVPPQLQDSASGYFFMVRQNTCDVYSRDNNKHEARASFKIYDVEGEGPFMFPAEYVAAIGQQDGPFTFKATESGDSFRVRYTFGEGKGSSDRVSFDPRIMSHFEQDIQTAKETVTPREFPINLLQFAFGATKGFLPKANLQVDHEFYRTIKMFGPSEDPALAKADGFMMASNSKEVCYFQCSGFIGKELSVPQQHLGMLESFLSRSTGTVKFYTLKNKTYAMNESGDVLGWPKHEAEYKKFTYYSPDADDVVVSLDPSAILKQLRFMRSDLSKDKFKIRCHYSPSDAVIHFSSENDMVVNRSLPVTANPVTVSVTSDVTLNVNVDHMIHMFEGLKGAEAVLRIKIIPANESRPKDRFMLRTIDPFYLTDEGDVVAVPTDNGVECRITRFAPSID